MSRPSALQLRVSTFQKKPRKVSEKSFEKTFSAAVKAAGRTSWHVNSREAGWPDRYINNGVWCELKVLRYIGTDNQLEPLQGPKMTELSAAGDPCFYVAKYDNRLLVVPWKKFRDRFASEPILAFQDPSHVFNYADIKQVVKEML